MKEEAIASCGQERQSGDPWLGVSKGGMVLRSCKMRLSIRGSRKPESEVRERKGVG